MDQNRENDQLKTEMELEEALTLLRIVREGGAAAEAARRQLRVLREIRQSDETISRRGKPCFPSSRSSWPCCDREY